LWRSVVESTLNDMRRRTQRLISRSMATVVFGRTPLMTLSGGYIDSSGTIHGIPTQARTLLKVSCPGSRIWIH
jgi:hypothetical protein